MSDQAEWDEWADDAAAPGIHGASPVTEHTLLEAPSSSLPDAPVAALDEVASVHQQPRKEAIAERGVMDWTWDLDEIERDLHALQPVSPTSVTWVHDSPSQSEQERLLLELATLAAPTRGHLTGLRVKTDALRALTSVTSWHLRRLHHSLQAANGDDEMALGDLETELQALAGVWGEEDETQDDAQIREMAALLQHSLLACEDGDIAPFQQAVEQLFSSLPGQSLRIPTTWIRPKAAQDAATASFSSTFDEYLQRLVALCDAETSTKWRVPVLSEAQSFQDAKDIQRDELIVNGELLVGTMGYEAVVTAIASHIRRAIAHGDGEKLPPAESTIQDVAKQILNACNRTESGGCSYEILNQFVTNHSMEHVLIRPASAKAPPLEISFDVGAFRLTDGLWSFGLRTRVSAVTWYCVCDANDPMQEYYDVQTTYNNRLAFPLGLSPLSSASLMRRDAGDVTISLVLNDPTEQPTAHEGAYDHGKSHETDLDSLL